MVQRKNTLFRPAKSKRLANLVDITSPTAFKRGLREAKKKGFTREEQQAFVLGKNRAGAQLKRENLSPKERKQFREIMKVRIPKTNRGRLK